MFVWTAALAGGRVEPDIGYAGERTLRRTLYNIPLANRLMIV